VGEGLVVVASVIAGAGQSQGGELPGIVIVDLGCGDIKLVMQPGDDGLNHPPLPLEGVVLGKAELYLAYTYIHFW